MADVKPVRHRTENDLVIDRARDFWSRYSKPLMVACGAVILLGGGYLAYKYFIQAPNEKKAADAIWKAQSYYSQDSLQKALKGDGQYPGFEKVINQYGSTDQGNLANYYAGILSLTSGDYAKAVSYLKDFSTDAKQIQARAYKLLGDAYANQGKNSDALSAYKKAGHEFEIDQTESSNYLFMAAYFADRVMNDKKEAVELFKELKKKYPNTQYGFEADKYLGQSGEYKAE
jgi:predicted negative regulator of RcsB-dependent stress response